MPGARRVGQPRQLAVVAARQVPPGRPDLLLDEVVVVDEPLGGGRDPHAAGRNVRDEGVSLFERGRIAGQARKQAVGRLRAFRLQAVTQRKRPRVLLELDHAEELRGSQERGRRPDRRRRRRAPTSGEWPLQPSEEASSTNHGPSIPHVPTTTPESLYHTTRMIPRVAVRAAARTMARQIPAPLVSVTRRPSDSASGCSPAKFHVRESARCCGLICQSGGSSIRRKSKRWRAGNAR